MNPIAVEDDIAAQIRLGDLTGSTDAPPQPKSSQQQPAGPSFMSPPKLEPFLLLAKSARGAGAAKLIEDVTAAPDAFVFGELLDMPSIKELATSDRYIAHYHLLQLFAYGTWKEYRAQVANQIALNEAQIQKLKMLTLVTLASKSRTLPYSLLESELEISDIRQLEDLIIEAIYASLLSGRLDQLNTRFSVDSVSSRDVQDTSYIAIKLQEWSKRINDTVYQIDQKITNARTSDAQARQRQAEKSARIQTLVADMSDLKSFKDLTNGQRERPSIHRSPGRPGRGVAMAEGMDVDEKPVQPTRTNRKRNRP